MLSGRPIDADVVRTGNGRVIAAESALFRRTHFAAASRVAARYPLLARALLIAGLAAGALGCPSPRESWPRPVWRWIESEPATLFDRTIEEFYWPLSDREELTRWSGWRDGQKIVANELGAGLSAPGGDVAVVRRVKLDAAAIERVEIELAKEGLQPAVRRVAFFWAASGEGFSGERRVLAEGGEDWQGRRTYELVVKRHPAWRGEIDRVGIGIVVEAGREVTLSKVAGYSSDLDVPGLPVTVVRREVFDLHPGEPAEAASWQRVVKPAEPPAVRTVIHSRRLAFDAGGVLTVEAVVDGVDERAEGHGFLLWAPPRRGFGGTRLVAESRSVRLDDSRRLLRFELKDEAWWQGEVAKIALLVREQAGESIGVERLTGLAWELSTEPLARAAGEGCRVVVGNELRSALPALPGVPLERELEVPRGSRLRLAYAAQGGVPLPVRFRVTATERERRPVTLFEAAITREEEQNRWHPVAADLDRFAGRRVTLRLETESDVVPNPALGLPYWGMPEVFAATRGERPPNVILISVDTLRPDRMSLYGHDRPTTPNLDAWADRAAVFLNTVAPAPWTLPSHLSLFSGLNAHRQGDPSPRLGLPGTPPVLSQHLQGAGYRTLAVTGGDYLRPHFGFDRGFDRFAYYAERRDESSEGELRIGLERALAWIGEHRDEPFFLFLHTYEVHQPFRARQPYFSRFTGVPAVEPVNTRVPPRVVEDGFLKSKPFDYQGRHGLEPAELIRALYDSGIAYADDQLARLWRELEAGGLGERTVVVLTSDHGELLGEHGLDGHLYLYEENVKVPLVIAVPGGRGAGLRIPHQVRLIDVAPTILDLAGLPVPADLDGVSLAPLLDGEPPERSLEAWTYASGSNHGISLRLRNEQKYVFNNTAWPPLQGREALYRLADGEEVIEPAPAEQLESLRRQVERVLDEEAPGLRLRIDNRGPFTLEGRIRSSLVNESNVKSTDLGCPCLRWSQAGEALLEVPPGQAFTLLFEKIKEPDLDLDLLARHPDGSEAALGETFDLTALEGEETWSLAGGQWARGGSSAPPAATVTLWLVGDLVATGEEEAPVDRALEAQLEALGYVN